MKPIRRKRSSIFAHRSQRSDPTAFTQRKGVRHLLSLQ